MMKLFVGLFVLAAALQVAPAELTCSLGNPEVPSAWIDMKEDCVSKMKSQIQKEIDASMIYLSMGAHFSRDTINRPGFADFFFKAAKEEREHGSKLIEYLSMRGELTSGITDLIKINPSADHTWESGAAALDAALKKEIEVTQSIRNLIKSCEKGYNHYHLVDYLTGVYLEEQLHGQRELAGKISTLKKMYKDHGPLAEFLFDKTLA